MTAEQFVITLEDKNDDLENVYHAMREFAKYHVQKALEAAAKEAKIEYGIDYNKETGEEKLKLGNPVWSEDYKYENFEINIL